jgi:hypothetical protein
VRAAFEGPSGPSRDRWKPAPLRSAVGLTSAALAVLTSMVIALASAVASPRAARAHRGSTKLLVIERTDEGANVEIELDAVDVAVALGLGEDAPVAEVLGRAPEIRAWVARGITLRASDVRCASTTTAPRERARDDGPRIVLDLRARCPASSARLTLHDDTVFDTDPRHEAYVRMRWSEGMDALVLRPGRQSAPLGEPPSTASLLGRFVHEGALHLVTGYDHMLFLLSLVLTAGGLAVREGMRRASKDVAWLVTAFTVGHSVTLIAAALGVVVLPAKPVESVIAASILCVALWNVWRPRARASMPWLAGGFGLVHGFGFSSVLAELGLPAQARVLSLVAFNVGIELAQLAFVALLLYPLAWLARREGYERWVVRGGSMVIGALASYWLAERLSA